MCGIFGVVNGDPAVPSEELIKLRDTLIHRGPDSAGFWRSPDGSISLGHRRLAILDLTEAGSQPMSDEEGRYRIVYNGEVYNFLELRQELQEYRFRSRTDTEVVLYAYKKWGADCVKRFRGMFSFAIWDDQEKKLFAARDRMSEKPFYYHHADGRFLFASELKAMVGYPGFRKTLDAEALVDFLVFSYIPAPKTIWRDSRKLPGGCTLVYDAKADTLSVSRYWDLDFTPDHGKSELFWMETILSELREAVRLRLVSDVPIGALLSGGVDSSSVVSQMAQLMPRRATTFSVGFFAEEFNEVKFGRNIARRYRTDHHERFMAPDDADEIFDRMPWYYDEPFNDYGYFALFYVSRIAREKVTVALSGDGGDELFCGYAKYPLFQLAQWVMAIPQGVRAWLFPAWATTWMKKNNSERLRFADMDEVIMDCNVNGFHPPEAKAMLNPDLSRLVKDYDPLEDWRKTLKGLRGWDVVSRAQYLDYRHYLGEGILTKVDRASMAVGLEVRAPFLDHVFVEKVSRIPKRLLIEGLSGKALLKKALAPHVPYENMYRRKWGFGVPLAMWLSQPPRLSPALNRLLDPAAAAASMDAPGTTRYPFQMQGNLFLDKWAQRWL